MPTIHHGDCIQVMNAMPAESVDAIVTDPPYGLGFMGKKWDGLPPSLEWAEACYRVLKPGGHIVAFGGTRTWHRLAVAIEDAGFEMRDSLAWLYGSGFPKSLDVSKAIDKAAGAERPRVPHRSDGYVRAARRIEPRNSGIDVDIAADTFQTSDPQTPDAERWQGWGTALKPAFEPIVLARKPFPGTVAANVLAHGTGAINVDACRIAATDKAKFPAGVVSETESVYGGGEGIYGDRPRPEDANPSGRWPANVVLDEHAAAWVDEQSGVRKSPGNYVRSTDVSATIFREGMGARSAGDTQYGFGDTGGASRFFYTAKAPKRERPNVDGVQHPTVKPLAIMRWLIRLVTPPGGVVLDPFAGSGTTVEAAMREGFDVIGIEREVEYIPLIQHRIDRQAGTLTA